jgi:hypothetical protein
MKSNRVALSVFLSALVSGLCIVCNLCCTTQVAGGTETGNGMVVGTLYEPCGERLAINADVRMRLASMLADTTGGAQNNAASGKTDAIGGYSFNSIDTGVYVLEGFDSANNRVLIKGVHVVSKDSTKALGPDTLKPAGAIKGKIVLSEGGDPRKVLIFSFGIDRFTRVNADGSFLFPGLAEGSYTLRILPLLPEYEVLDTTGIVVTSSDTTDVDSLLPRFTGIPTPKNVTISYDTLKQIVTLTWNRSDTALVKGYNIYRRETDSGFGQTPLNGTTLVRRDTGYTDTTPIQDRVYEYKVVAIDNGDNPGKLSTGATVIISSAFKALSSFGGNGTGPGEFTEISEIKWLKNGTLIALDYVGNRAVVFDSTGNFFTAWGAAGTGNGQFNTPVAVTEDDSGFVYIMEMLGTGRIQKFDGTGRHIASWTVGPYCRGVAWSGHKLYVTVSDTPGIKVVDLQTDSITRKSMIGTLPVKIAADTHSMLCLTDGIGKQIIIADSNAGVLGTVGSGSSHVGDPGAIALGPKKRIYVADAGRGRVYVLDSAGIFVTKLTMVQSLSESATQVSEDLRPRSLSFNSAGNLFVADKFFIRKYSITLP